MKLKTTEKGFTLIEVLVALGIAGAIMGVMSAAVITIIRTTSQNDEWNVNLRQVQNAGYWITRDALMAQVVSTNTPNVFLKLSWSDWNNIGATPYNNIVDYYFDGNTLRRRLNNSPKPTLIAEYIVLPPTNTTCYWNDNEKKLTVKIRASLHGNNRYVEKTYEISPRPANRGG